MIRSLLVSVALALVSGLAPAQSPAAAVSNFTEADMRASRVVHHAPGSLPATPSAVFKGVDMRSLFIVVEAGDHHVTVFDGDRLGPVHRFASRGALAGDPQFTPEGRYVFFASRDGWVSKFDLWNLTVVAEVRTGLQSHHLAVSGDGRFLAVANDLPNTLVLMDADLQVLKIHTVKDKNGTTASRISAVYDAPPRGSFIATLKDVPEVWELSYQKGAEDIPVGMVHDFQYKEGAFITGFLNPRRSFLAAPMGDFFFSNNYSELMGLSGEAGKGPIVNLDVRKRIADWSLPGMPQLAPGRTWQWQGRPLMPIGTLQKLADIATRVGKTPAHITFTRNGQNALASLAQRKADGGALLVLDAATLKEIKRIPMDQPLGAYKLQ